MFSVIRIIKRVYTRVKHTDRGVSALVPSGIGFASPPHYAAGNWVSDISKRLVVVA